MIQKQLDIQYSVYLGYRKDFLKNQDICDLFVKKWFLLPNIFA